MEKDFQAQIMRWHDETKKGHLQRIPDMPWMQGRQSAFQFKKPYDIYWLFDSKFHALELKQEKGLSFSLSHLADHQEEHLLKVMDEGGYGWVLINFNGPLSKTAQKKYGVTKLDKTFGVLINDVVEYRVTTGNDKLTLEWLSVGNNACEIKQVKLSAGKTPAQQIGWDLVGLSEWLENKRFLENFYL